MPRHSPRTRWPMTSYPSPCAQPSMPIATVRTHARVALAGNPSDAYGGRTLAVCIDAFAADVTVATGSDAGGQQGDLGDAHPLVEAAVARFGRLTGHNDACVVGVNTTIPLE